MQLVGLRLEPPPKPAREENGDGIGASRVLVVEQGALKLPADSDPFARPRVGTSATIETMLHTLPGWVIDDASSVREEVQEWIGTTAAERWRIAGLCSQDAMWAVRASEYPQRILDHIDALPDSTLVALTRLRRLAGWGHGFT